MTPIKQSKINEVTKLIAYSNKKYAFGFDLAIGGENTPLISL